jgi:hypothetical protein
MYNPCRIVNAEADFLSGLIVDRYEDVLVTADTAVGKDVGGVHVDTASKQRQIGVLLRHKYSSRLGPVA